MKLADLSWAEVIQSLPRWEALSPAGRTAFLALKPGVAVAPAALGPGLAELREAGLILPPGPRGTNWLHAPEIRTLLIALRAADRLRPLEGAGGRLPVEYVQDQLNTEEVRCLKPGNERSYYDSSDRQRVAEWASSAAWIREYLDAAATPATLRRWEEARMGSDRPRLVFPAVAAALLELVRALPVHPRGVPLGALGDLLRGLDPNVRAAALAAGVRYLLLFVSIRRDGPEAVVGLLPAVAKRLSSVPTPPPVVPAEETFEAPMRVADVTALLVEAVTDPIPVKASDGGSLFVRAQRLLAGRMMPLPAWVEEAMGLHAAGAPGKGGEPGDPLTPGLAARIEVAANTAARLDFVSLDDAGRSARMRATRAGQQWLARPESERLKHILTRLRGSKQRAPFYSYGMEKEYDFFGVQVGWYGLDELPDVRPALTRAFLSLPENAMVPLDDFLTYHSLYDNPLLARGAETFRRNAGYYARAHTPEAWERLWSTILEGFLVHRLAPYGGARLGMTAGEEPCFGLTDAGRYLLGAVDDFELAAAPEGEVVVQPDFEVVFLAPAPRVEAELGRFAERTGAGVGALFRITRASVLRAAEQGLTADAVVETLERASRSRVPANVARQVRDWIGGTRRVTVRPAVLIDCPDAETAGRVRGLGGLRVSEITPTLLRLNATGKEHAAFVKKLRDKGIFVQD